MDYAEKENQVNLAQAINEETLRFDPALALPARSLLAEAVTHFPGWSQKRERPELLLDALPVDNLPATHAIPAKVFNAIERLGALSFSELERELPGVDAQRLKQELWRMEGRGILVWMGEEFRSRRWAVAPGGARNLRGRGRPR